MFSVRIVGRAAVASFGPSSCYLLDAASFVGSAVLIGAVSLVLPAAAMPTALAGATSPAPAPGVARIVDDIRQGLILSGILSEHLSVRHVFALCAGPLVLLTRSG